MRIATLIAGFLMALFVQPAHAAAWEIQITSPTNYQTFQRDSTDQGTFTIAGWYIGNPRQIQASWRGSPWVTIDNTLTAGQGSFRGTLTGPVGQGTLVVRFSGTDLIDKTYYVGVGDVYAMAGQSNMMGYGYSVHQYTPTTIRATMLGNDDKWAEFTDPYDSATNQVDPVSRDTAAWGSWVAWVANAHIRETGVPVAFIPAAKGGSTIARWAPSTDRNTLYGSMWRRIHLAGAKVKAVLWFQGEADPTTSIDSYKTQLEGIADAVARDFPGAKLMPTFVGPHPATGVDRVGARVGTLQAIEGNDNIVMGPALYDVNLDDEGGDGSHFRSHLDLAVAGNRFWAALDHAFYGGEVGYGPRLATATVLGGVIRLEFDTTLGAVTATPDTFWVLIDGARHPVLAVDSYDNTVELVLDTAPTGQVTVSYGHDNRSAINAAVYNSSGLPAVPFYEVEAN